MKSQTQSQNGVMPISVYKPVALVTAIALATTMVFGLAAPAEAATANAGVYAIAPEWGGFCPDAGKLNNYATYVKYVNHTTGSSGGDSGDDIVWMPVVLNQNNSVTISVTCKWSTPIGMSFTIKPTRNKQSWWFSIWGQTWKN